jgi:hypothetical protein
MRDEDLPDGRQDSANVHDVEPATGVTMEDVGHADASLFDDVGALIDDGRTYLEAEIAFQKSRAAFAADRGKSVALLGLFAFAFVHLALVALVVGAVIALAPLVGGFGATAIVVGVLILLAAVLAYMARNRARELGSAFQEPGA